MLYCPKKTKKTKVWRPWAPPGPGGLQTLFFFGFFGTVRHFACFCLKRVWFFWDSTAFLQSQASKVLYCPKKTNLFKAKSAKMLYCPQKNKKKNTKFGDLGLLQGLEVSKLWFFLCFWGSTAFLLVFA